MLEYRGRKFVESSNLVNLSYTRTSGTEVRRKLKFGELVFKSVKIF